MKTLSLYEKYLFLSTFDRNDVFNNFPIDDKTQIAELLAKYEELLKDDIENCGLSKDFIHNVYNNTPKNILINILVYCRINELSREENKEYSLTYFQMEIGRDPQGRLIGLDFEDGIVYYYDENKNKIKEVNWLCDNVGKYIVVSDKKEYKHGFQNMRMKLMRENDEKGTEKFLELLHLFIDTKILTDGTSYYIADNKISDMDTKKLGIFLSSSFAYRYRSSKQTLIKIPIDFGLKNYSKEDFINEFSLYVYMGLDRSSYIKPERAIKRSVTQFKNSESGITISLVDGYKKEPNKYKFFKTVLPNGEVYILR